MSPWEAYVARSDPAERRGLQVIGQTILHGRLAAHLTQRQLAFRAGINQSTLSRLERGRLHAMRLVTLARIVGALAHGSAFVLPGEPPSATRRLPGELGA
jgi:transcriptional regulator with XRE-family HTH domain